MHPLIIILLFVVTTATWDVLHVAVVKALPDGAPVCRVGVASPDSLHTFALRTPMTGSLNEGGFQVLLDDEPLDPAVPKTVNANETIKVVVTSLDGIKQFRGVLLILSQVGYSTLGTFQLTTDDELSKVKISDPCIESNYGGITHINADLKDNVTATMSFDENYADLRFDVNIVVQNRNALEGGSEYYYSQYSMKVEGAESVATKAPTGAPTRGCGLFGLTLFCPLTFCGFFARLFFGREEC
jgi:Reeler domain